MRRRMFVGAAFCRPFICFSRLKHSTHYVIMEFNKKYGGGSTILLTEGLGVPTYP